MLGEGWPLQRSGVRDGCTRPDPVGNPNRTLEYPMATVTAPRPRVKSTRKPVVAELTLTINGTPYVVVPIAPGPDNTKAVRLVKHGNADTIYDCCSTTAGVLQCDCPDFECRSPDQCG